MNLFFYFNTEIMILFLIIFILVIYLLNVFLKLSDKEILTLNLFF